MKILVLFEEKKKTIIEELKQTESIEEVAAILKPYRYRGVFLEIINRLLNELSDTETELRHLKEQKKGEEIEVL